ncbi:MAG: T9SS type A sorting domain-containing protein [Flavobacteriales bacterium]|nr:T9SS type A sorting domain-containing protein [Flavobacteriales bacterium]
MTKQFYSLLTAIVSLSMPFFGHSQEISSLTIIPEEPIGTNDIVSVIAEAWHPSSGCPIVNTQITQSQDTIFVEVIHDLGLALAICESKDTTTLGTFDQGTYTVAYLMTSGVFGDISVTDTAYAQFTVQGINSISNEEKRDALKVYPNPSSDFFYLSTELRGMVSLMDSKGSLVKTVSLIQSPCKIETRELTPGIYIIRMNDSNASKGVRVLIK